MIIETESSTYELDLTGARLRRWPRSTTRGDYPGEVGPASTLRKDEEWIPFTFIEPPAIGRPARFLLAIRDDGVPTVRTTTLVVSITT
jgi:hypothetical protein